MSEETVTPKIDPKQALDALLDTPQAKEPPKEVSAEEQAQPEQTEETEVEDSAEESQESLDPDNEELEVAEKVFLNDFAADTGSEMGDIYELSVKMPNEGDMTITELKNFRIDNNDIDEVRQTLQTEREELQVQSESMQAMPQVSNELKEAQTALYSIQDQYSRTDWDSIRQNNPAEWTALQQDFRNRYEGAKAEEAAATKKIEGQQAQARQFQTQRLFAKRPELNDEAVRIDMQSKVSEIAKSYGYTGQEIAEINDHRAMMMLMDLAKKTSAVKSVKEKIKKSPPKKAKSMPRKASTRGDSLKRLHEKAQSGSKKDVDAYFDEAFK